MPATVPTKPAAGAMVDAAWGADVHDRIYTPSGIVVSGAATPIAGSGANGILDLSNVIAGDGDWLDGADGLKCPVGKSGWYNIYAHVQCNAGPATGTPIRFRILRDGAYFAGQSGVAISPSATAYLSCATWLQINDGNVITVDAWCGVANSSWTATRISVVRSSHTIASALQAEAKPA
jgi:hypothetical protein